MSASEELIEELVCNDQFCKYVLNPDEETINYWEAFRKNNPDKEMAVLQARQLVLLLGDINAAENSGVKEKTNYLWSRISSKLDKRSKNENQKGSQNTFLGYLLKVAAVFFLMGLISLLVLEIGLKRKQSDSAQNQNYFQRSTQIGQKASFFLPDGSHINLNSGSSLYYYENQETSTRELTLEGEAFLDVKEDPNRPFIVKTKYLSARVLGTSFNVKAYHNDDNTKIALVTGKVKVTGEVANAHVLTPNQMAVFNRAERSTRISLFDPEKIICWKDNVLLFDEVGLSEIISTLSRWYGVEFVISDSLKEKKELFNQRDYRGKYKDKSLETVLEAISFSYGFAFEVQGKKVFIK